MCTHTCTPASFISVCQSVCVIYTILAVFPMIAGFNPSIFLLPPSTSLPPSIFLPSTLLPLPPRLPTLFSLLLSSRPPPSSPLPLLTAFCLCCLKASNTLCRSLTSDTTWSTRLHNHTCHYMKLLNHNRLQSRPRTGYTWQITPLHPTSSYSTSLHSTHSTPSYSIPLHPTPLKPRSPGSLAHAYNKS